MKRLAASALALGLVFAGVLLAPQAAFAATDVHGKITKADGTTPIFQAFAEFYQGDTQIGSAYTDADGDFSTSTIPAGDYTVFFYADGYATEYYSGTYLKSAAAVVTVADGVPLVLNASLEDESTVTGTIRDYNGDPVESVEVDLYTENSGAEPADVDYTDATGNYSFGQLGASNVKVFADYQLGGGLQPTWYTNGYSQATATVLPVPGAGGTAVADIVLPLGATIQGTVVDPIGSPVSVDVTGTGAGLDYPRGGGSASDGTYSLRGLHPQDYSVTTSDYWGLFAPATPQNVTAVVGTPATANFVVTPALVDEAEFTDAVSLVSGPTTVEPGKTYTWVVQPGGNDTVYAILYSSPVYLGAAVRAPDTSATLTLTIPAATTPGAHKLTFSSMNNAGEGSGVVREYLDLTVSGPVLAATGVDATAPALAGFALLLAGAAALALRRRPARTSRA
ncbi:MAG: hypothetical protein ABJB03_12065 [Rhodoglobus sp.]